MYGMGFVIGYFMNYFAGMFLNKESANFTVYAKAIAIAIALQTPFSILVFVITKLGTENTPLWSIIPSLVLIGLGIFIWKRWEIRSMHAKDDDI